MAFPVSSVHKLSFKDKYAYFLLPLLFIILEVLPVGVDIMNLKLNWLLEIMFGLFIKIFQSHLKY